MQNIFRKGLATIAVCLAIICPAATVADMARGGGKKMKDQISNRNKGFFPEGMTQGQKTLMGFTLFFLLVFCYIIARADVQLPALG